MARRGAAVRTGRAVDPLPLRVCVPASTSNLGPGFDLIGVALSLDLTVEAVPAEGDGRWLELADEAADWPREDNLLARAFDMARGDRGGDYAFRVTSEIPLARGLGSSGAAVAAGLLLGRAAARGTESREQLLALGLELEGHPDNVAPALFGGARACVPRRDGARMVQLELHPEIGWSVAWPEVRIATEVARAALPREVPFADAVENPRRLALLLEGLRSADPGLLRDGIADRLHVRPSPGPDPRRRTGARGRLRRRRLGRDPQRQRFGPRGPGTGGVRRRGGRGHGRGLARGHRGRPRTGRAGGHPGPGRVR